MARKKDQQGAGAPQRLTPVDIQQIQFRRAFRGYDEQEVDDFLDRITEEFTALIDERRSLSERAGSLPTIRVSGAEDVAAASRQAEEILRKARDQGDAIVREAQARAIPRGPQGRPAAGAGISAFVTREREFLQELAQLVQGHAQSVKDMVQAARESVRPAAGSSGPAAPLAEPPAHEESPAASEGGFGSRRDQETAARGSSSASGSRSGGGTTGSGSGTSQAADAEVLRVPEAATGVATEARPGATGAGEDQAEPPVAAVPRPGEAASGTTGPESGEPDESLRELFWGED